MGQFGMTQFDPTSVTQSRQMAQIRLKQRAELERLQLEREMFETSQRNRNQILEMFESAFGEGGTALSVPQSFRENVDLFQPGGQFGEGGKAEVERGGQQAIAAGQIGLARTGMSSGTNVSGLRARVLADTALARKKIEDERVSHLGIALKDVGQAQLSTQQLASQERQTFLSTLGGFR